MTASDPDLVVFLASSGSVMPRVLDVLRDWVAYGLVHPFVWIDEAEADPQRPLAEVTATAVSGDRATRVRLRDHLADQPQLDRLRLVALSSMGRSPRSVAPAVAGHLYTGLGGEVSPVHCLLARHGEGGWEPQPAWAGWHTVVIAPEDSRTPGSLATDLTYAHTDTDFYNHVAATLAAVVGLWTGMADAPFDEVPQGTLARPVVARAFLRRLDASAVTAELRSSLTDLTRGLPRPRHGHSLCELSRNPEAAADKMAKTVFALNESLLAVRPKPTDPGDAERISVWRALALFFKFLGAALRRAPYVIGNEFRNRAATALGQKVQDALFGADSQYQIVTATGNGQAVDADEFARDVEEVNRRLQAALPDVQQGVPDVAPFWRSVVDGAMTLADGGERRPEIPPDLLGSVPAVIAEPSVLAPSPNDSFAVPPEMVPVMGTTRLEAVDVRAHEQLAERLATAATGSIELARVAERLHAWRASINPAFTSRVGSRLADEQRRRAAEVRRLNDELVTTMAATEAPTATRSDQLDVVKVLLGLLGGWAVLALMMWLSLRYHWFTPKKVLIIGGVVGLAWLTWLVIVLVRQQKRIFATLAARNRMLARHEAAVHNLGYAVSELRVVAVLYSQYLAWATLLGAFLRQPFGQVSPPVVAPHLAGPLPRAMGLGRALPDRDQIDRATHDLGATVFASGWLSPLWASFVADAPRRLGRDGLPLRDDPSLLFRDEATNANTPLRLWKQAVVSDGVLGAAGDELWSRARGRLQEQGSVRLAETLFRDVDVIGQPVHGTRGRPDGAAFLTQLVGALNDPSAYHFSTALFRPAAASQEEHRVEHTFVAGADTPPGHVRALATTAGTTIDLDQFVVVVQLSASVPPEDLCLLAPDDVPPDLPTSAEENVPANSSYPDLF
jgi:hypothetical protein